VYSPVKPVMFEVSIGAYPTAILGDSVDVGCYAPVARTT
jgi:hypothetical protein